MKVYIEMDGTEYENENFAEFADKMKFQVLLKWKYKTMWALRSIEREINEEGGIIIVTEKGLHTRSFTRELTDKIQKLVIEDDASSKD